VRRRERRAPLKTAFSSLALLAAVLLFGCTSAKPPKPIAPAVESADRSASQAAKLSAQGNWQAAAGQWQSALDHYRLINDRSNEAIALHNLAEAKDQTGDHNTAHSLFESAAALNSKLGNDDQWWRNQIALLELEARSQQTTELAARFEKLTPLSKQLPSRGLKALFLNELGLWHSGQGKFDDAGKEFAEALQLFRVDKNESGTGTVLANQALLLERQNKYHDAAQAWAVAQKAFETLADPTGISVSMAGRGRSLLEAGEDLPAVEDFLRRAAQNFRVLRADKQAQEASKLLERALTAQGKNER
jgi:tetratricopeptide (TPR) repeat protein